MLEVFTTDPRPYGGLAEARSFAAPPGPAAPTAACAAGGVGRNLLCPERIALPERRGHRGSVPATHTTTKAKKWQCHENRNKTVMSS